MISKPLLAKSRPNRSNLLIFKILLFAIGMGIGLMYSTLGFLIFLALEFITISTALIMRESTINLTENKLKIVEHAYFKFRPKTVEFDPNNIKNSLLVDFSDEIDTKTGLGQLGYLKSH